MNLAGLQKLSLIDYPGKTCAVVFTQGCMFKCKFCHNAEILDPTAKGSLLESHLFEFLSNRVSRLDGVTISGGEPCIQKELPVFIEKIKKLGFLVKLDTTGYYPRMLQNLLNKNLLDYIAMDVKAPLEKYEHITQTHVYAQKLRESIRIIKESGIDYEFRTTLPRKILNPDDIMNIGKEINGAKRYVLQHFNNGKTLDPTLKSTPSFTNEEVQVLKKQLKEYCEEVLVR